jgi:hypothetical protein
VQYNSPVLFSSVCLSLQCSVNIIPADYEKFAVSILAQSHSYVVLSIYITWIHDVSDSGLPFLIYSAEKIETLYLYHFSGKLLLITGIHTKNFEGTACLKGKLKQITDQECTYSIHVCSIALERNLIERKIRVT